MPAGFHRTLKIQFEPERNKGAVYDVPFNELAPGTIYRQRSTDLSQGDNNGSIALKLQDNQVLLLTYSASGNMWLSVGGALTSQPAAEIMGTLVGIIIQGKS